MESEEREERSHSRRRENEENEEMVEGSEERRMEVEGEEQEVRESHVVYSLSLSLLSRVHSLSLLLLLIKLHHRE